MRIFLSLMGLLFFLGVHAQDLAIPEAHHFKPVQQDPVFYVEDYREISVSQTAIERWYRAESDSIRLSIPGLATVWVYKQDMLAPGFTVQTDDGKILTGKEYTGVQYLARSGLTSLSVYPTSINAIITQNSITYNLGPDIRKPGRYILSRHRSDSSWQCHTEDDHPEENSRPKTQGAEKSALSVSCKIVRIGIEADFHTFQALGSVQAVTQHLSTLFNASRRLYQAEGIIVQLGSITVWTTADPYRNLTSASTILLQFATNRPVAQMTDNLLHLVSMRPQNLGGIAYTDVLCNASVRHGFSRIHNTQIIPLPNYSWSVYVITHEIGHNFASRHTHWCGWSLPNGTTGRIDSCYAGEGTCGGTTRPRRGTIMSYCHLTSQGIDFNLGFGPMPGNLIRSRLAAASCIATSAGGPCDSLAPPPPPPPTECVSTVQHFTNAQGRSCYRFRIRPGCRYTVSYCRYDGFPQGNPPPVSQTPSACGVRLNNYLPTPAELAAGWVEREASPQPSFTGFWYSVRVVAATGPSGLVFFWWP